MIRRIGVESARIACIVPATDQQEGTTMGYESICQAGSRSSPARPAAWARVRASAGAGRRRGRARRPPHRAAEGAARRDRGRGRRRARGRARRHRPRTASRRRSRTPRPRSAPIDILVNNSGVGDHAAADGRHAGGLRLRVRHQHARRVLRRAGGRQAHDWRAPTARRREAHRRAHHQHRVGGRPARAAADRRLLR